MKIAVCGTPAFAAQVFEHLRAAAIAEIKLAITTPDTLQGRGEKLLPPPVKEWASRHQIPVWQPEKADSTLGEKLKGEVDVIVVIAYGRLFPADFLNSAPPAWNLHLSLLPKYRGTSPVPAAILAGETTSGVTVFHIGPGMDDGPILGSRAFDIKGLRADAVYEQIVRSGSLLLNELLRKKAESEVLPESPQIDADATFSRKITKQDGFLDPSADSAETALRKIRAYYPWPSAWIEKDGKRIKLLNASDPSPDNAGTRKVSVEPNVFVFQGKRLYLGFADGPLEILEIQPEGKRVMSGTEFSMGIRSNTTG